MENSDNNMEPESVIKSIMVEQEEKSRGALDPFVVAINAMNGLKERERDVIINRYGLENGKKVTLEAVGKKFNITRERVRQIESATLRKLIEKPTKDLVQLIKLINSHLSEVGGVLSVNGLTSYLKSPQADQAELKTNALRLVMDVNEAVVALPNLSELQTGWMKRGFPQNLITPILSALAKVLTDANRTMTEKELWEALLHQETYQTYESQLSPTILTGLLSISTQIAQAADGKWGLAAWPTVVPKRIRDKVFLILEVSGKPKHFTDIAEAINRAYPAGKPVLSRTVHNELIGDKRFLLVGRGIYALKSWGFQPGVVLDVVKEVLKQAGRPLSVEDIIEAVLAKREVKRNTVVANLQNKSMFRKVGRGLYELVE